MYNMICLITFLGGVYIEEVIQVQHDLFNGVFGRGMGGLYRRGN